MLKRILHELAAKHITERLLASPAFRRFAEHTHDKVEELKEQGAELADELKHTEAGERASDFIETFKKELKNKRGSSK